MPSPRTTLAALLDPGQTPPPLVLTPAHVGGSVAWSQLRAAGALAVLNDVAAVPAGTAVRPVHRALALAHMVPSGCVLAASTAAWVHTGLHPDLRTDLRDDVAAPAWPADALVELAYSPSAHCPVTRPGHITRRLPGLARDTTYLESVPVTTLDRTAVDVARTVPCEAAVPVLLALSEGGMDLDHAEDLLDRHVRVLGRPAARRAFAAARKLLTG